MSINIIDKLKHASGGAVADAADIEMDDGTRLSAFLEGLMEAAPASLNQTQYEALSDAGLVMDGRNYMIVRADAYMPKNLGQAQLDALSAAGLLPEVEIA